MRFNKLIVILLMIIAIILAILSPAVSSNNTRIAVMTFDVDLMEEDDPLENIIVEKVKKQLGQWSDISIVQIEDSENIESLLKNKQDMSLVNKFLDKHDLNGLIWGKIRKYDENHFVLYVNLFNNIKNEPFVEKVFEGISNTEELLNIVETAIKDITLDTFGNDVISEVNIQGNIRIKDDLIFELIKTKSGSRFERKKVSEDIRSIYQKGFFNNVKAQIDRNMEGIIISFQVEENPIINKILFVGNDKISSKKIQDTINLCKDSFLEVNKIKNSIEQLKTLYVNSDYHNIGISYNIVELEENQVILEFIFDEQNKVFINSISFSGNIVFDELVLKNLIESSSKGYFSWITGSGKFSSDLLLYDENCLLDFYRSNGFINVKIGETVVNIENNHCNITFIIEEGNRFLTGKCVLQGDLIKPEEEILELIKVSEYKWFNVKAVQQDIVELTKLYLNEGFANADIFPIIRTVNNNVIEVAYSLKKNNKFNIGTINISGNTVTRDAVIRRELRINENDIYNKDRIERSLFNIRKLQYFENIKVEHEKNQDNNQIELNFKVKEKPTGRITFGAGYSSTENFFISGSVSQENLMGRGQSIRLSGTFGSDIDRYNLSFNEPWLLGIPLSGTLKFYKEVDEKTSYQRTNDSKKHKQIDTGLYLGFSYPLTDFVRISLGYRYNVSESKGENIESIDDIKSTSTTDKSRDDYIIGSIHTHLSYDSRDGTFYTKRGSRHVISFTQAGFLGGNLGLVKLESSVGFYIPTFEKITLSLRGKHGWIEEIISNKFKPLRDSDRFYLGGMNTIRAYNYKEIGIEEITVSKEEGKTIIGGNQYLLFNLELLYPIYEELSILGVVFYDVGEVFDKCFPKNFKQGIGCGIRWFSPIGPIRIEAAYKLGNIDNKEKNAINWNVAIGVPF